MNPETIDVWARALAGLVTVGGSAVGAIWLLIRYQRTFVGDQDAEIDSLRDRLDEVVDQLTEQRVSHEKELSDMRIAHRNCEMENSKLFGELQALKRELATVRRQFAEALEGRVPYSADDNPRTRAEDVESEDPTEETPDGIERPDGT